MCRHILASVIARDYGPRWETIKNVDKAALTRFGVQNV
ncbi:hypothetical protein VCRA2133E348_210027 [Vibrio crassostreae]|nr:hypothetical protein VCRA2119O48_200027 [Vibrio crassostreae]CAK2767056.1 hypothetical protein VCRA2133E348_210027 [Vibrio crassostreae]CAK3837156.1 hypothetical protein VCRA212O16_210027 [Vibrio crassostreae]